MPFVCFDICQELKVDSITQDNIYEIKGRFCRGHYENGENLITTETEKQFIRDEVFEDNVALVFLPDITKREEIYRNLYELLLLTKHKDDEVIPECIYL